MRQAVAKFALAAMLGATAVGGCECTEGARQVTDYGTGATQVEILQKTKKDLDKIQQDKQKQAEDVLKQNE